jgi:hypothetical protein
MSIVDPEEAIRRHIRLLLKQKKEQNSQSQKLFSEGSSLLTDQTTNTQSSKDIHIKKLSV